MIRKLGAADLDAVCGIVNDNWKSVYAGYVDPQLFTDMGCWGRTCKLKADLTSGRLSEYVWEERGQVAAMLSVGDTADQDKEGSFEIWRIYVAPESQGKGIGNSLLSFAEQRAADLSYQEILIWAFRENVHALSFYQKHGYHVDREEYLAEPYFAVGTRLSKEI